MIPQAILAALGHSVLLIDFGQFVLSMIIVVEHAFELLHLFSFNLGLTLILKQGSLERTDVFFETYFDRVQLFLVRHYLVEYLNLVVLLR